MIEIRLNRGYIALVSDEDAVQARFKWTVFKGRNTMYAMRNVRRADGTRTTVLLHQVIAGKGADHRDGDGLNCQRSNLRPATKSQNAMNRGAQRNSVSGIKGVIFIGDRNKKNPWRADIKQPGGGPRLLGCFPTAEAAARAYDVAARGAFGEFAHLNFPQEGPT